MGGGGSHAQSAHGVPLPAHQLQQIQRSVGRCGMILSRQTQRLMNKREWVYSTMCGTDATDTLQLTPHLSRIIITHEPSDLFIFYF